MADPKTGSGTSAPKVAPDLWGHKPGVEATVTPGKGYGVEATIRDTDKRNGKTKSLLNVPASRA
jgi:hypothetical protein